MVDKTISHCRILDKIGEGGMGVVDKAGDITLHRELGITGLSNEGGHEWPDSNRNRGPGTGNALED